jgi:hypothetical protein
LGYGFGLGYGQRFATRGVAFNVLTSKVCFLRVPP